MHAGLVGLAAGLMQTSGVGRLIGRRHAGVGVIYMLHSIVTGATAFVDPFMQVQDTFLDDMLGHLVSEGVEFVSLDEALQRLEQGAERPFACFTLDDGYRDNLTVALPVFRRWNCPITIYVTTALIEHRMPYEWGCLRELIASNDHIEIEPLGLRLRSETLAEKSRCFKKIFQRIAAGDLNDTACDEMFARHGIHAAELQARDALTEFRLANPRPGSTGRDWRPY